MTTDLVIQNAVDALALGSLYALFALGIAVIFGIMRLINFAHGELITAGAYALVLVSLPVALVIPVTLVVVVALALVMERVAFRPVRDAGAATLLITSFALSFLLQAVAALTWGSLPRTTDFASGLSSSFELGQVSVQKLDLVIIGVTLSLLVGVTLFFQRTTLGIQMRAAAEDLPMARLLGIRANMVVASAFALSGLLAAAAAILLTAQTGSVSPTIGLSIVLFAFMATIVGGMGSLPGAVVGGFLIGALTVTLQASLPLDLRPYRDAFVFAAVLAVLVVRPQGLLPSRSVLARELARRAGPRDLSGTCAGGRRGRHGASPGMAPARAAGRGGVLRGEHLAAPRAHGAGQRRRARRVRPRPGIKRPNRPRSGDQPDRRRRPVHVLGHLRRLLVRPRRVHGGGRLHGRDPRHPARDEGVRAPRAPRVLADVHLDPFPATIVAGGLAAAVALVLSVPLSRLSGLTAGLATFAVLSIVNVVARNLEQVTHGTAGVSGIPTTTTIWQALGWALAAMACAWGFQRSRIGLRLRASREDESAARSIGVAVARERTMAFVLSAFFVGAAGALFGMFIGSFNPDAFFLNITFLMVAMLIVGGMTSLAGAVVGTIVISAVSEIFRRIEGGLDLGLVEVSAKPGLGDVGLALVMLAILIFRPEGLTGGREVAWPFRAGSGPPST